MGGEREREMELGAPRPFIVSMNVITQTKVLATPSDPAPQQCCAGIKSLTRALGLICSAKIRAACKPRFLLKDYFIIVFLRV